MTNESVSTLTVNFGGILYFNNLTFDLIRILLMRKQSKSLRGARKPLPEKCIYSFFGNPEWENLIGRPCFEGNKMLQLCTP